MVEIGRIGLLLGIQNMIINDDCLNALKTLEDDSIDSLVTDPPYGIEFMGKHWDQALPLNI